MKLFTFSGVSYAFWSAVLLAAGVSHFILADFLVAQMPPYFDEPRFWVYLSGIAELALAGTLQVTRFRRLTWWLIAAMCVVYLPVHWYVATECEALADSNGSYYIPCWLAWLRLPMQFGLIIWTILLALKSPVERPS